MATLPYNLTEDDLRFDRSTLDSLRTGELNPDMIFDLSPADGPKLIPGAGLRIFTAAVALYEKITKDERNRHVQNRKVYDLDSQAETLIACFDTAIIWECG